MKHFLYATLLLRLFLNPDFSFSQANAYFTHDPVWNVSIHCRASENCIRTDRTIYYTKGDTLIKGNLYKKIFEKKESTYAPGYTGSTNPPTNCSGWDWSIKPQPSFFVRSLNKKMFILHPAANSEQLLYDFDLQIGDTLPYTYNHTYTATILKVSAIDSIYTPYGWRKRFSLSSYGPQYLVEGIGNSRGFIEYFGNILDCGYYSLDCFSLNDTAYFPSKGETCNLAVGIDSRHKTISTSVFPNPFSDATTINFGLSLINAQLNIYNAQGQKTKTVDRVSGEDVRFQRESLAPGLYFFEVVQENRAIGTGKLVVTD